MVDEDVTEDALAAASKHLPVAAISAVVHEAEAEARLDAHSILPAPLDQETLLRHVHRHTTQRVLDRHRLSS